MRIIAGEFRSRKIKSLPGTDVRPTPDRLRETLFNIIAPYIPGATFLDAYAGTGAVGIEALSRGADRAIFLEKNKSALGVIRENLISLDLTSRATVISGPVTREIGQHLAHIVFIDPPYDLAGEYAAALEAASRNEPKLLIAQHSSRFSPAEGYGKFARYRVLKQGDNSLSFYRPADSPQ